MYFIFKPHFYVYICFIYVLHVLPTLDHAVYICTPQSVAINDDTCFYHHFYLFKIIVSSIRIAHVIYTVVGGAAKMASDDL